MIIDLSFYSFTLMITTIILGILAVHVWNRRSVPGGIFFALLMAAAAEWAFMSAVEYTLVDISAKILSEKILYIGAASISPLWLLFALDYSRKSHLIDKKIKMLIWVPLMVAIALVMTNEYHGLIWSSIEPVTSMPGDTLVYNKGIVAMAIIMYAYILTVLGFLLLFRTALRDNKNYFHRTMTIVLGAGITAISSMISIIGFAPLQGMDLTPFAFAIMGVIFSWGAFGQHIFDLMPVAMEKLVGNMADGVLVLNRYETIVKINATAQRMFGVTDVVVGQHAEKVIAEWPALAGCYRKETGGSADITINGAGGPRWIDASVSHLHDDSGRLLGTLIILRDITERKNAEALRKQSYDALQSEVAERRRAEAELAESLKEKELLLKEIHHRVKNNMQIISSLMSLQTASQKTENFADCMKESQDRIKTMALIHEKLYKSGDLAHIDYREYVQSLVRSLSQSYIRDHRVAIETALDDVSLNLDYAIPCGLIINELVSNSLKYAFPAGEAGAIRIAMSREGDRYTLIASDDGVGFPEGIDFRNTTSLGLQLVVSLTVQLDGEIELVESAKGTTFQLTFRTT